MVGEPSLPPREGDALLRGTALLQIPKKPNQSFPEGESEPGAVPGAEGGSSSQAEAGSCPRPPPPPLHPFLPQARFSVLGDTVSQTQPPPDCHNLSALFSKLLHVIAVCLWLRRSQHSGKHVHSPLPYFGVYLTALSGPSQGRCPFVSAPGPMEGGCFGGVCPVPSILSRLRPAADPPVKPGKGTGSLAVAGPGSGVCEKPWLQGPLTWVTAWLPSPAVGLCTHPLIQLCSPSARGLRGTSFPGLVRP